MGKGLGDDPEARSHGVGMRLSAALALLAALAMAVLCVRLGFWQLSRLEQKRAMNRARRQALEAPVMAWRPGMNTASFRRRIQVTGSYDPIRQILLRGRSNGGMPGVEVLTPLRIEGSGAAVLVDRGWLPAADGATARPEDYPEPGVRRVVGFVEPGAPAGAQPRLRMARTAEGAMLLGASRVVLDSLGRFFPYPLLGFTVRALPDSAASAMPVRAAPRPLDEGLHLSYAVQWFSFAFIILVGSGVLVFRSRLRHPRGPQA